MSGYSATLRSLRDPLPDRIDDPTSPGLWHLLAGEIVGVERADEHIHGRVNVGLWAKFSAFLCFLEHLTKLHSPGSDDPFPEESD